MAQQKPEIIMCNAAGLDRLVDVRFGSEAEISGYSINVRFTPESGHRSARQQGLMHRSANQRIVDNSFGWRLEEIARERQQSTS